MSNQSKVEPGTIFNRHPKFIHSSPLPDVSNHLERVLVASC